MLTDYIKALPQYLMPGHLISRVTHMLTRIRQNSFKNGFIRLFIRLFSISLDEAKISNIDEFEHFNAFFTRALKPEARPINQESQTITSPVDGTVSQAAIIRDGRIFQAKGHYYSALELLGGDHELASQFSDGYFTTLYLSPRDYHRIHIPVDATLRQMIHVPGRLFSVNPATTRVIPGLFARNERVVSIFETPAGLLAVAKIGAVNVGSIETVWHGEVTPPAGRVVRKWVYNDNDIHSFSKGDEIGRFNMGSTVILLFANQRMNWNDGFCANQAIKMGETIGKWT